MNTRRSTARPLSVCALLAMGAISLAACGNQSGNDVDNSSQAQSSTSAAASSSETTSKKKEADLSVDQSMGGGAAVWQFPVIFSGWKFGQLDQPGAMQLTNDKGGQYTATQSAYPSPPAPGDRAATQEQTDKWIQDIQAKTTGLQHKTADSTEITASGQPVQMMRTDAEYVGADGRNYRAVVWIRSFTQGTKPGFVSLTYATPTSSFSEEELKGMLEQTKLMNIESSQLNM